MLRDLRACTFLQEGSVRKKRNLLTGKSGGNRPTYGSEVNNNSTADACQRVHRPKTTLEESTNERERWDGQLRYIHPAHACACTVQCLSGVKYTGTTTGDTISSLFLLICPQREYPESHLH